MHKKFGLREKDIDDVIAVLRKEKAIERAVLFGSRAKGDFKNGSDVDIALQGKGVTDSLAAHAASVLNDETSMPYKFDVLNFNTIDNPDLIDHIQRVGVVFYTKIATAV
jgi:predicted nucleotidyltransferase